MCHWIDNLRYSLTHRAVTILHGNVRDVYVSNGCRLHENLTALLRHLAATSQDRFDEFVSYDVASGERRERLNHDQPIAGEVASDEKDEFDRSRPDPASSATEAPLNRVLATWNDLLSSTGRRRFVVFQYLDKCVAYKKAYAREEQETLLWLEKTIENIAAGNRLVLVALQDSMVPVELYTNAPKAALFAVPRPAMSERMALLRYRIAPAAADDDTIELVAGLTDGSYLRELEPLAAEFSAEAARRSRRQIQRLVNKYRVGEQEDYWGSLCIDRIHDAYKYFVEEEGVRGQDEAVTKVTDTLCLARAGLAGVASGTAAKPRGVLFFAGPTGVGKTMLAKKLAKFLFTTEDAFVRFDMSEFKEEHTVAKLIGSPPGYVGFEEGGSLTNGIREKPFCVLLFDEIEKAHPKILDIFLQILDDGRLTDSRGQTVYFTETLIIFTSNIGTRATDSLGRPVEEAALLQELLSTAAHSSQERQRLVREHFAAAVERFFVTELSRPELLNRIGNRIVPFNPIDVPEVQQEIVASQLQRIAEEVADRYRKQRFAVYFDPSVCRWLVDTHSGRIAQFGGRGVTNAVENEILTPLARSLLQAEHSGSEGVTFACRFASDQGRLEVTERGR